MKQLKNRTIVIVAATLLCSCSQTDILNESYRDEKKQTLSFGINEINSEGRANVTEMTMTELRGLPMGISGFKRDTSIYSGGFEYVVNNVKMTPEAGSKVWTPTETIGINRKKKYSFLTYGPYIDNMAATTDIENGIVKLQFPQCQDAEKGTDYVVSYPLMDVDVDFKWNDNPSKAILPMTMKHLMSKLTFEVYNPYSDGRIMYLKRVKLNLPDTTKLTEYCCNFNTGETYFADTTYNYSEYIHDYTGNEPELIYQQKRLYPVCYYIAPLRDENKKSKIGVEYEFIVKYNNKNTANDTITVGGEVEIALKSNKNYYINLNMQDYKITFYGEDVDSYSDVMNNIVFANPL